MSAAVTMEPLRETSPRVKARIAGVFYLLIFVTAPFAEVFVRGRLVVAGDAAATATNILAHEALYRLGFAAQVITLLLDTAVALILYDLLKPVSRSLSLSAAVFRLMLVAIMAVNLLLYLAPLTLLRGARFLTAFTGDQLQALGLASHSLYGRGYDISLVFFGFHCLLIGYLIFRSAFLPRILAALMAIACLCYLTNGFATFLAPALANALGIYIILPAAVAELLLTLWLVVMGVNEQRWLEQAGFSADGGTRFAPKAQMEGRK